MELPFGVSGVPRGSNQGQPGLCEPPWGLRRPRGAQETNNECPKPPGSPPRPILPLAQRFVSRLKH